MTERGRALGLGLALMDEKILDTTITLPKNESLLEFVNKRIDTVQDLGGVVPNILSAYTTFSPENPARLLACVGKDLRGTYYQNQTDQRLGKLQTHDQKPTGIVASVIDGTGTVIQRERFYAAAETVRATKEEIEEENILFISDLFSVRLEEIFTQGEKVLSSFPQFKGTFMLNLAGATPAIDSQVHLLNVLRALPKPPDIIIGNNSEFCYLTDAKNTESIIDTVFPQSRIVIATNAERGSFVRYEGTSGYIPAFPVSPKNVVDETGAGDSYAGIFLSCLYRNPYSSWNTDMVQRAAHTASFGASLIVQTKRSRLTTAQMEIVQQYDKENNLLQS